MGLIFMFALLATPFDAIARLMENTK